MIRAKCKRCHVVKYCSSSYGGHYCRKCWPYRAYVGPKRGECDPVNLNEVNLENRKEAN